MNLHMQRRMETLAKEIAAAKKPKIDQAANAAFDQAAQKPLGKTIRDLKSNDVLKPCLFRGEIDHRDGDTTNNELGNLRIMYEALQTEVADRIVALSIQLKQAMKDAQELNDLKDCFYPD